VQRGTASIYKLQKEGLQNNYYILSGKGSRNLLAYPEVIGYDCYTALLDETSDALSILLKQLPAGGIDIFTILRGGLNYPLEEAAHKVGIPVKYMHFVSCERIIVNKEIMGLDVRYQKITPSPDRVIAIGDIIATGDTLKLCMEHLWREFNANEGSIRRIIMFTIGGTRAIDLAEKLTASFRERFPGFEGIDCCFFEGIFTVYGDKGVSGINTPDIDFGWKGGLVAPEFRRFVAEHPDALLEKCIIYDGGARRYEIPLHCREVLEYWEGILERASIIDDKTLIREKLGYDAPISYEEWLQTTGFSQLGDMRELWEMEQAIYNRGADLADLARRRIASIKSIQKQYETDK